MKKVISTDPSVNNNIQEHDLTLNFDPDRRFGRLAEDKKWDILRAIYQHIMTHQLSEIRKEFEQMAISIIVPTKFDRENYFQSVYKVFLDHLYGCGERDGYDWWSGEDNEKIPLGSEVVTRRTPGNALQEFLDKHHQTLGLPSSFEKIIPTSIGDLNSQHPREDNAQPGCTSGFLSWILACCLRG